MGGDKSSDYRWRIGSSARLCVGNSIPLRNRLCIVGGSSLDYRRLEAGNYSLGVARSSGFCQGRWEDGSDSLGIGGISVFGLVDSDVR
jgi:hypothetical protein